MWRMHQQPLDARPARLRKRDPIGDKALLELDLDATQPAQTALLAKLADAWIAGSMPNQAIREGANHETNIGHATFKMLFALAQADG